MLRSLGDDGLSRDIAAGSVVSFPHTALRCAGPLQARVVVGLYRSGVDLVVALGVLHSGSSAAYREALDESCAVEARRDALAAISGGHLLAVDRIETPFGDLPTPRSEADGRIPVRVDRDGVLADEFSLDAFFALMRRAADVFGMAPLPVLPVFVGPTRDPIDGSFDVARRLAAWVCDVRARFVGSTALVVTGDLVHYGSAYGDVDADATAASHEQITSRFRRAVEQALAAALTDRDWALAHRLSSGVLRSDQREILAPISAVLGPARARLLHFELSDYAEILASPPPCLVASSLAVYERIEAPSPED